MNLSDISTKELAEELATREGVEKIVIKPYEPYTITANNQTISEEGPVLILEITD